MITPSRLDRLWQSIDAEIDALLITDLLNVRYMSGYTGSFAKLLLTREQQYILSDIRYVDQVCIECSDFTFVLVEGAWETNIINLIEKDNLKVIGFEGYALSYNEWEVINSALPGVILASIGNPIGGLRQVKDDEEIALIKEAARIVDTACVHVLSIIQPGMTERQITAEIDCALRKFGANKEGFDTIVVSGSRSALIHGKATDRCVGNGDLILMDFGADYRGYNSDITRTVVIGEPDSMQEKIYRIVLDAQQKAIEAIKPGVSGKWVDSIARDYIADSGYGDNFGHGLGHGLGLAVHDGKAFSKTSDIILEEGIIATVEPGIYITGWGGIRIEDDILVTSSGCEILTSSPKSLKLR